MSLSPCTPLYKQPSSPSPPLQTYTPRTSFSFDSVPSTFFFPFNFSGFLTAGRQRVRKTEMIGKLAFSIILFPFVFILHAFLRGKRRSNARAKLPPGTMGWPYIGETLQLYSQNPNIFFATKQKRWPLSALLSSIPSFASMIFIDS